MVTDDLTPLHIRGKKRKRRTSQPSSLNSSRSNSLTPSTIKRSKPSASNMDTITSPFSPRLQSRRKLSPLELLPTELLEPIFITNFHITGSISLLRVSPHITRKLDSALLRRRTAELVFRAFRYKCNSLHPSHYEPDDGYHTYWVNGQQGVAMGAQNLSPADKSAREYGLGGTMLQLDHAQFFKARSALLTCRWFTPELFLEMREKLLQAEEARLKSVCMAPERYTNSLALWLGEETYIPRKMLRWPMDGAKLEALQRLVEAGCRINWEGSVDGEVAVETVVEAVREMRWDVMLRLMDRRIGAMPSAADLTPALEAINWRPVAIEHLMALAGRERFLQQEYSRLLTTKASARHSGH